LEKMRAEIRLGLGRNESRIRLSVGGRISDDVRATLPWLDGGLSASSFLKAGAGWGDHRHQVRPKPAGGMPPLPSNNLSGGSPGAAGGL